MKKDGLAYLILILIVLLFSGGLVFAVWSGPDDAPPVGNPDLPIDIGSVSQFKSGKLNVGGAFRNYSETRVNGNLGVGVNPASAEAEINGAIKIGDNTSVQQAGMIRYWPALHDFCGYDGNMWHSFTGNSDCYMYSWDIGGWAPCTETCGGGTQSRTVYCRRSDGINAGTTCGVYPGCNCPMPDTSQPCNTQPCCTWQWSSVPKSACVRNTAPIGAWGTLSPSQCMNLCQALGGDCIERYNEGGIRCYNNEGKTFFDAKYDSWVYVCS